MRWKEMGKENYLRNGGQARPPWGRNKTKNKKLNLERMMTQLHEDLENSIQSKGPASAKAEQEMSLFGRRKESPRD